MSHSRIKLADFLTTWFSLHPEQTPKIIADMAEKIANKDIPRLFDEIPCWMPQEVLHGYVKQLQLLIDETNREKVIPSEKIHDLANSLASYGRPDIIDSSGKALKFKLVKVLNLQNWLTLRDWKDSDKRDMLLELVFRAYISRLLQFMLPEIARGNDQDFDEACSAVLNSLNTYVSDARHAELAKLRFRDNATKVATGVVIGISVVAAGVGALFAATRKPPKIEMQIFPFSSLKP